jgi:hypothetical protein
MRSVSVCKCSLCVDVRELCGQKDELMFTRIFTLLTNDMGERNVLLQHDGVVTQKRQVELNSQHLG